MLFYNKNTEHCLKLHVSILQTHDCECVVFIDTNIPCNFYISPVALFWLDISKNLVKILKQRYIFHSK